MVQCLQCKFSSGFRLYNKMLTIAQLNKNSSAPIKPKNALLHSLKPTTAAYPHNRSIHKIDFNSIFRSVSDFLQLKLCMQFHVLFVPQI